MTSATQYQRYIGIDWSGADREDKRVNLRVAEVSAQYPDGRIVPPSNPAARSWSRAELRDLLKSVLRPDQPRCLIGLDFSFSYPYGADRALFKVEGWHAMLGAVAVLYDEHGTARATAEHLNSQHPNGAPFRFNETRNDFRFYCEHDVPYYRLTELVTPQAISEWYLGSGGTVGFHTITGMAALHDLIKARECGNIDFHVWAHEGITPPPDKHVLVECYPAIFPPLPATDIGYYGDDERDALKIAYALVAADRTGALHHLFCLTPRPFGRVDGVSFEEQIRFEGWIFGVM